MSITSHGPYEEPNTAESIQRLWKVVLRLESTIDEILVLPKKGLKMLSPEQLRNLTLTVNRAAGEALAYSRSLYRLGRALRAQAAEDEVKLGASTSRLDDVLSAEAVAQEESTHDGI